jgi:prenyltransferase beta subunit
MAIRRLVALATAAFLISLIFSLTIVHATYGIVGETRRTVLTRRLIDAQLDGFGAFGYFHIMEPYFDEVSTTAALLALKTLNALDRVDVNAAVTYLFYKQHPKNGGFGTTVLLDYTILPADLYTTFEVVDVLKEIGALSKINQTALKDFVLSRYNQSLGAFSEPIIEANGRKYAISPFPLGFRTSLATVAYAIPNVISTFSAVSILADVDALNLINVTKTLDFIMSTRASNGVFKPYPTAKQENLPGWSSLLTNPFDVDSYGTGIPYTYAAIGALESIGRLDVFNQSDKEQITEYVLSCLGQNGDFIIHKDWPSSDSFYTFYAVMTLNYISTLNQAGQAISIVQNHILETQQLGTDNQWPLPQPESNLAFSEGTLYGVFDDRGGDPLFDTTRAVRVLNITSGLSLLDQTTPRSMAVLGNMILVSVLVTVLVIIASWSSTKLKARKDGSVPQKNDS